MGNESDFWRIDVSKLKHFGEIDRIEDVLKKGVSDCIYCLRFNRSEPARAGWAELKRLQAWPARMSTLVRLPHYSEDQVNYLERWGRAGMGAYLIAQVANDYLVFHWREARAVYEGLTRERMLALAKVHGNGAFPTGRVLRVLTQ